MLRCVSVILSVLALALTAGRTPASAQSVEEIIARNIQAKGGLEKLRAVESMRQTAKISMQGTEGRITISSKRPNLVRQEISISGGRIVAAYNGKTAWIVNPLAGAKTPMVVMGPQADAIRDQSEFDGPLIDYKSKGYHIEFVGNEQIDGKRIQRLRITDKNKRSQECLIDAETGLEWRIVQTMDNTRFEQTLSDFRDVEGIKVPFLIQAMVNGVEQSRITVEKVELNVKFDDALFQMK